MLVFGAPALLVAGALAALLPVGLHLLRPLPGDRRPLPTARFLSRDPRTRIRVAPPDQPFLLALRILLLLLVGAALARPGWVAPAEGRAEIVLLDRAAADPATWRAAVDSARGRLASGGALILFDSTARVLAPEALDTLGAAPPARRSDLAAALAALPVARGVAAADSVRLTLVSPVAASSWGPGAAAVRAAVWPGRLTVVDPGRGVAPAATPERSVAVMAAPAAGRYLRAAAQAMGFASAPAESAGVVFVTRPVTTAEESQLDRRIRAGATVVREAAASPRLPGTGALEMRGPGRIAGAAGRSPLRVGSDDRVVGAWEDGTPAVTVRRIGSGCRVRVGAALEGGQLPRDAAFPRLVGALAGACAPAAASAGELDAGARATLVGDGPEWVIAPAGASLPVPLGRWLMALAALVAAAELIVARRRTR